MQGLDLRLRKTATDPEAARRLAREALWLRELADVKSLDGQVPRLIEQGTDPSGRHFLVIGIQPGTGETRAFTPDHARFLANLGKARFHATEFEHAGKCQWIQRSIASVPRAHTPLLEESYYDCEKALLYWTGPYVLAQGDFAPWNIRTFGSQLFVFDWGSAHADASPLDDVLHYLMIQRRAEDRAAPAPRDEPRARVRARRVPRVVLAAAGDRRAHARVPARRDPAPQARQRGDPVVDAYWKLLEKRSAWMKET